jgi:hypothetical protein
MPMNPRLLRPTQNQHPEAADWASRVRTNGGTVSGSTLLAVSRFCRSIDLAGIRNRFYRLNLFCGTSDASLVAPRVPLYRGPSRTGTQYGNTIDTNVSFVQGDYAETGASGGLTSNGSKRLTTGFKPTELPSSAGDTHIGAFAFAHTPTSSNHWMIGTRESTGATLFMRTANVGGGTWTVNSGVALSHLYGGQHPAALYLASRRTTTDLELYENTTSRGTSSSTSSVTPYDGDNWVFSVNNQGSSPGGFPFRLGGYTLGIGMTSGQVASLSAAWAAFNTALSRT